MNIKDKLIHSEDSQSYRNNYLPFISLHSIYVFQEFLNHWQQYLTDKLYNVDAFKKIFFSDNVRFLS